MAKRKVFYSFYFKDDVMRTQQVRNIGSIEGLKPVSHQAWEEAGKTNGGIERWIDLNLKGKDCLVVLIGAETANRPWVKYEIRKAYEMDLGVIGIYIHNLKCPREVLEGRDGRSKKGQNPFTYFKMQDGNIMSSKIKCYEPSYADAYNDIAKNIESLVEQGIREK